MKRFLMMVVAAGFFMAAPAHAWNCTQPGQIRVQVPAGTVGNGQGDGPGQVVTVEGITFQCQTPATPSNPGSTLASTSSANSTSTSASNSTSSSNATGGNSSSSATGGNQKQGQQQTATGGSVSGSGNSTNNNSASASNNGNGANNSSYESTTNVAASKIPVAPAAPVTILPANPCFKGFGGGVQTMVVGGSFGGGKIDQNCSILEAARLAPSPLARCKVYISNKYVRAAGVTLEDCLAQPEPAPAVVAEAPQAPAQPSTVIVPAPQVTVNVPAPVVLTTPAPPVPDVAKAAAAKVHHKHPVTPCVTNDTIERQGPPTNKQ